jgi:hypothetical protein
MPAPGSEPRGLHAVSVGARDRRTGFQGGDVAGSGPDEIGRRVLGQADRSTSTCVREQVRFGGDRGARIPRA